MMEELEHLLRLLLFTSNHPFLTFRRAVSHGPQARVEAPLLECMIFLVLCVCSNQTICPLDAGRACNHSHCALSLESDPDGVYR
jgi:hypothetical protein